MFINQIVQTKKLPTRKLQLIVFLRFLNISLIIGPILIQLLAAFKFKTA